MTTTRFYWVQAGIGVNQVKPVASHQDRLVSDPFAMPHPAAAGLLSSVSPIHRAVRL
jgi:hypothetical protein